ASRSRRGRPAPRHLQRRLDHGHAVLSGRACRRAQQAGRPGGEAAMSALLEARDVSRSFGSLWALQGVSFSVQEGELLGLIGPNGAGKSTLYNVIAGVLPPTRGEILFRGRSITGWKSHRVA